MSDLELGLERKRTATHLLDDVVRSSRQVDLDRELLERGRQPVDRRVGLRR